MTVEGFEEEEKEQADGEDEVEGEADMGDEGHYLPIREVGDGEPADKADDGYDEKGANITCDDDSPLDGSEGLGGKHHKWHDKYWKHLTQGVEASREIACPCKRHGREEEVEYGQMEESVGLEVGKLAMETTLENPVDEEERPCEVHHEIGTDGTARKEGKEEDV